jgi:hypothetical protein
MWLYFPKSERTVAAAADDATVEHVEHSTAVAEYSHSSVVAIDYVDVAFVVVVVVVVVVADDSL